MTSDPDERVYYVISDLHIGGDEQLERVDFLDELLVFLRQLKTMDEDVELVINGDAFGLWELTHLEGIEKFDHLVSTYPELFDQLRATGEQIDITLIPGNHDHDLAAYEGFVEAFEAYNVELVPALGLDRPIGDRLIRFEHGHQQDPNNRIEDFGNPHVTPLGYYYNTHVISRSGRLSDRGRFNWLKDLQAVTPTERLPLWLLSKYFYREMNPALRYAFLPFLLLFNISAIMAILAGLDLAGIWSMPADRTAAILAEFGQAGATVYLLLTVNVAVAGILLLVGIPMYLIIRDFRRTLDRFGIMETDLTVDPKSPYILAAESVFDTRPETVIYCYGHTHRPKIIQLGDRLLVNTGTWLKRLYRRDVVTGLLPPVFYPAFQLCAVRIAHDENGITVDFERVEKPNPSREELTRVERLLTLGREPAPELPDSVTIPEDTM